MFNVLRTFFSSVMVIGVIVMFIIADIKDQGIFPAKRARTDENGTLIASAIPFFKEDFKPAKEISFAPLIANLIKMDDGPDKKYKCYVTTARLRVKRYIIPCNKHI